MGWRNIGFQGKGQINCFILAYEQVSFHPWKICVSLVHVVHRPVPLCLSEVHLSVTSFGKPFPTLLEKVRCTLSSPIHRTCTSPRKHSLGFAVAGFIVHLPCSKSMGTMSVGHSTFGTQKNVLMGGEKRESNAVHGMGQLTKRLLVSLTAPSCFTAPWQNVL